MLQYFKFKVKVFFKETAFKNSKKEDIFLKMSL